MDVVSIKTIYRWINHYKLGRESVENIKQSGRPRSVVNKKSISTVKFIIDRDERVTVNQIAKMSKISSGSVFKILTEYFRCQEDFCEVDPHILNDEQKR